MQFHRLERHRGNEETYYLARHSATSEIFVLYERSTDVGGAFEDYTRIELEDFLARRGSARDALLRLIGTLLPDEP